MNDWLGTETVPKLRKWRSFRLARKFARQLKLQSSEEWVLFRKGKLPEKGALPADIPRYPRNVYRRKGWSGYGDWLGTGRIAHSERKYRSFTEARAFARSLHLSSLQEWNSYCRGEIKSLGTIPPDIPATPQMKYQNQGWAGVNDWLGTTKPPRLRIYRSFRKARAFARSLRLSSLTQWKVYSRGQLPQKRKLPDDIPRSPWQVYLGKGWISAADWLGTSRPGALPAVEYWPFDKAKTFVSRLALEDVGAWKRYCKGRMPDLPHKPRELPTHPHVYYGKADWRGWPDWLGTHRKSKAKRRH
jgi:hypothetical protein